MFTHDALLLRHVRKKAGRPRHGDHISERTALWCLLSGESNHTHVHTELVIKGKCAELARYSRLHFFTLSFTSRPAIEKKAVVK